MPAYTSKNSEGDVLLANPMPQAEYMYGCTPTAMAMLLGYHDLYGYQGKDLSNIIEGTITVKSRGTDGNAYDMDAFDTVIGRAIASKEYVYRFHSRDGVETTPEQELVYAFKSDNKTLNTDEWNCLADYLGTGQFWRGRENLSTTEAYGSLEEIYNGRHRDVTITNGTTTRTVAYLDTIMLYGLDLYVKSRGYALDYEITGTYRVDANGGSFTFNDYKKEIDSGRPVLITITGHSMVGYGYNAETQEIIFDDCYKTGQRMKWTGTYRYSDEDRKLQSITVVGFNMNGDVDVALANVGSTSQKLVLSGMPGELPDTSYCIAGANGNVYLTYVAANLGSKKSGEFTATVRVDGKFFSSTEIKSIPANGTYKVANVPLGKLSVGIHNVRVILDESNEIQETNGANNSAGRDVLVLKSGTSVVSRFRTVQAGETVSDLCMMNGGTMYLEGRAVGTVLLGKANVSQGAVMSGTVVCSGGNLQIYNGGTVTDTRIAPNGAGTLNGWGAASETVIESGGRFTVRSGGTAAQTTVESGGRLYVSSGGTATGRLTVKSGATANFTDGGILNFDLSGLAPGAAACVNDLSRLTGGTPVYTLTVSGTQAHGTYKLAGGAAGFNKSLTVANTAGVRLGTLKVKGTLATGNAAYRLKLNDGVLSLSVLENGLPTVSKIKADITAPTCRDVTVTAVFADDVALAESLYRIGETGAWTAYTKGGVTVSENTTVYFKAVDTGGNESEIESYKVTNIDKSAPDDGGNDWLYDKKRTPALNPNVADAVPEEITAETTDILMDSDQLSFGVWRNYAGFGDEADWLKIRLDDAAGLRFRFGATDAAKLVICSLVTGTDKKGNTTYSLKALQTTTFKKPKKADEYTSASKLLLLEAGDYFIFVQSTVAKKGGGTFYNLAIDSAKFFYGADDGSNDFLYDKKTKTLNDAVASADPVIITEKTKSVLLDASVPPGGAGRGNYVGFGDAADYAKISLESAASLSFLVGADDAAKFVIYSLVTGTDKKGNTTYTLKQLQSTTLKKAKKATVFSAETKNLLLEAGDYYISVQSTNAKKGGEAYYDVRLGGDSRFFTAGDDGRNDYVYDKKAADPLNPDIGDFVTTELASGTEEIRLDRDSADADWNNFVGFGDAADYATIRLSADATLSFSLTATDAAKFVIYSLVTGTDKKGNTTYTQKSLQSTALKKAKDDELFAATTKALSLAAGEYFISMQSTNAKKGGAAFYSVTLNRDACEGLPAPGSALAVSVAPDVSAPGVLPNGTGDLSGVLSGGLLA